MDSDDRQDYLRRLTKSIKLYAETYPSATRRSAEIANSTDPYVVQFNQDLLAAVSRQEVARRRGFVERYGLTAREARVALHLAAGGSVADYAAQYGLSEQTVRTQLKAAFAKTGVNRQSALANLLFSAQLRDRDGLE